MIDDEDTRPTSLPERLLAGHPPAGLDDHAKAEHLRRLHEAMGASRPSPAVDSPSPRTARSRRWLAMAAALVAIGGTGVAGAIVKAKVAAVEWTAVRCFSGADAALPAGRGASFEARLSQPASQAAVQQAVAICQEAWASGRLADPGSLPANGAGLPPSNGSGYVRQPPAPLVTCRLPGNVVGVFPGTADTCDRLRLPRVAS